MTKLQLVIDKSRRCVKTSRTGNTYEDRTNTIMTPLTAAQIAERVRGEVLGDGSTRLTGFAAADSAQAGDLTFADTQEHFAAAEQSAAAAILVPSGFSSTRKVLIRVPNARVAMARLLPSFFPPDQFPQGIHPS